MPDLFDVNIGGLGWHIATALVALAALFVACFAIMGYITFRDNSVPLDALEAEEAQLPALSSLQVLTGGISSAGQISSRASLRAPVVTAGGLSLRTETVSAPTLDGVVANAPVTAIIPQPGDTIFKELYVSCSAGLVQVSNRPGDNLQMQIGVTGNATLFAGNTVLLGQNDILSPGFRYPIFTDFGRSRMAAPDGATNTGALLTYGDGTNPVNGGALGVQSGGVIYATPANTGRNILITLTPVNTAMATGDVLDFTAVFQKIV